ncbi:MAG: hypothetical protein ABJL67_11530, partial [Sulfitobacter sp.]
MAIVTVPLGYYTLRRMRPDERINVGQIDNKPTADYIVTHLGDAQPDILVPLRVVHAKLELLRFIGVQVVRLESVRIAAG